MWSQETKWSERQSSADTMSVICVPADSDQHPVSRHHHPAQHRRHRAAGVLRGRGRLRQHLRTYHQGRGAAVGGDANLSG